MKKNIISSILLICILSSGIYTLFGLSGCGDSTVTPVDTSSVQALIDPNQGGTLTLPDNTELMFPPGSVTSPITVTLGKSPEEPTGLPSGIIGRSSVYYVNGDNNYYTSNTATVKVPISNVKGDIYKIYYYDEGGKWMELTSYSEEDMSRKTFALTMFNLRFTVVKISDNPTPTATPIPTATPLPPVLSSIRDSWEAGKGDDVDLDSNPGTINFTIAGTNFGTSPGSVTFNYTSGGSGSVPSVTTATISQWSGSEIKGYVNLQAGIYLIKVTAGTQTTVDNIYYYKGNGNYNVIQIKGGK